MRLEKKKRLLKIYDIDLKVSDGELRHIKMRITIFRRILKIDKTRIKYVLLTQNNRKNYY